LPEVKFDPNSFFFHGTNNLYAKLIEQEIIITKRKGAGVDFGPGFYLTQDIDQAKEFTKVRTETNNWAIPQKNILDKLNMTISDFLGMKNQLEPVIMVYRLKNPAYWAQLIKSKDFVLFSNAGMKWKRHIWTWRQSEEPPVNWQATFGPVADGGGIYSSSFTNIKAFDGMDQLAIHNKTLANDYLDLVEVIPC